MTTGPTTRSGPHVLDRDGTALSLCRPGDGRPGGHGARQSDLVVFSFAASSARFPPIAAPSPRITWDAACRTNPMPGATIIACAAGWPIFSALMDHLELDRVTLLVHDWGGMIAMAWGRGQSRAGGADHRHQHRRFFPAGPQADSPAAVDHSQPERRCAPRCALRQTCLPAGPSPWHRANGWPRMPEKGLLAPYNCPRHRLATLRFVQDIPLSPGDPGFDIVDRVGPAAVHPGPHPPC